jgi:hypothetical protein
VLLNPSPSLPDDTLLDAVALPTRIKTAFAINGLKTVGDVRETTNANLLSFRDFGRGSLTFCREVFGRHKVHSDDTR